MINQVIQIFRNLNKYKHRNLVKQYLNSRGFGHYALIGDGVDGGLYSSAWFDFQTRKGEIVVIPNITNRESLLHYPYKGIEGNTTF